MVAQNFQELRVDNIEIIPQKAREMVLKSNMLIFPSLELNKMFLLDQVQDQEDPMLVAKFDFDEGVSGNGYNTKIETIAIWIKQKKLQNPKLLDVIQGMKGAAIVRTIQDTTPLEAATMTMQSTMFTGATTKGLEDRLKEYEKEQRFLNDEVNKLFMENVKLKEQLRGARPSQSKEMVLYRPPIAPMDIVKNIFVEQVKTPEKEVDDVKKANNQTQDEVKIQIYEVMEKILEHRIKLVMDKLENVHDSYKTLQQEMDQIKTHICLYQILCLKGDSLFTTLWLSYAKLYKEVMMHPQH